MKRNLIILIGLWILSLVGISFFGGPVSYGFFFVLTILPVISFIYLVLVMSRFRIYQTLDSKTIVSGAQIPFYFTLQNEDFFTFAGIKVTFFSSFSSINGLDDSIEYELQPLTGVKKKTVLVCNYRGEYQVGINKVIAQDFFRLFNLTFNNRETVWVKVRPKLIQLDRLKSRDISAVTSREIQINPQIPDILVREYIQGDDIRKINWNATAHRNQLMVRKQVGESQPCIGIVMDSQRYYYDEKVFIPVENKMLELNLALSLYYLKKNMEIHSLYYQGSVTEKHIRNIGGFDEYYNILSAFAFKSTNSTDSLFVDAIQCNNLMNTHSVVFIIHEWSEKMAVLAEVLSNNNIPVVAYIVNHDSGSVPDYLGDTMRFEFFRIDPEDDLEQVL